MLHAQLIVLDFGHRNQPCEEYKSWTSSLYTSLRRQFWLSSSRWSRYSLLHCSQTPSICLTFFRLAIKKSELKNICLSLSLTHSAVFCASSLGHIYWVFMKTEISTPNSREPVTGFCAVTTSHTVSLACSQSQGQMVRSGEHGNKYSGPIIGHKHYYHHLCCYQLLKETYKVSFLSSFDINSCQTFNFSRSIVM
jgi:hypothetical protein